MSGHFFLKEPLALSDGGKNVHEKLLRLCACLCHEKKFFFEKAKKMK
jgi:hypothetical protein